MQKRALITGITGQDGSYLAELLLEKGYEVHGIVRRASTFNRSRIDHLFSDVNTPALPIDLHYGDVCDSNSLIRILHKVCPNEIFHLAAQSHVGISFDTPEYTGDVTGLGTTRFLEALRTSGIDAKFYQASSSELYGKATHIPQNEETPFYPRSPYACAKAYAFYLTRNYRESYGMFAVNGILFNHESPRRGENFVTRKITLSLAQILSGQLECMHIGNLDAKRDWGYAKEYVEAMWLMLQQERPEDFVIATGRTASVREFLELCLGYAGIRYERRGEGEGEHYVDRHSGKVIVKVDRHYYRPAEVDFLVGDASKASHVLGWVPKTTVEELAKLMLEADCQKVGVQLGGAIRV
ncbi:GDP-mannose 4,6-dehydratase [Candidatus Peregrinibacteria bacterium CG10_big_fil_rev_8_21_14_0_10_49_16]|nr:MAG: GDP-mannose 4,6-dehydratase [Candidatus Peregrinibacteria bacterium CG22_combo_CG10-13_8_21_14_all_49_11]PIR51683.1 MAG: GDP-mannose 4,6-dehydratase [Candidatus Peregrinibacteria bacterium CG10_big_fil_rev_8_21_14_0_10_49_16]